MDDQTKLTAVNNNSRKPTRFLSINQLTKWTDDARKLLLNFSTIIIILTLVPILLWIIVQELTSDSIRIESFLVSEKLKENGFSGEVVKSQFIGKMVKIKEQAQTSFRGMEFVAQPRDIVQIEVPGVGVSLGSLIDSIKTFFGFHRRIGGELLYDEDKIHLTLHIRGKTSNRFRSEKIVKNKYFEAVQDLLSKAAQTVYEMEEPYLLAIYFYHQGPSQKQKTVSLLRKALLNPNEDDPWAYNLLGILEEVSGNYDAAIEHYTEARALDPNFALAYLNRGRLHVEKKHVIEASWDLSMAATLSKSKIISATAFYELGRLQALLVGNYDRARTMYTRAIEHRPGLAKAYYGRGRLYYWQGLENVRMWKEQKTLLNPNPCYRDPKIVQIPELSKALADYKKASFFEPEGIKPFNARGEVYQLQGMCDEAVKSFMEAIDRDSTYSSAYYNLGQTYFYLSNFEEALVQVDKALNNSTDNVNAHLLKGKIYFVKFAISSRHELDLGLIQGHLRKAQKYLCWVINRSISPDEEAYEEAHELLKELADRPELPSGTEVCPR